MFALIRANRLKSAALIIVMAALFILFGYALAASVDPKAGPGGVVVAIGVWAVLVLIATAAGEKVLLAQAGARKIERAVAPQLFNVVEEMQIAAGLPVPPDIYLIDSQVPNAFAVGLNPKRAAIAVTTGLLARLNRDELQGVIGHEMSHIANRDTLFMTLAGVTVGAIIILADFRIRGMRFSTRDSKNSGQAAIIIAVVALILIILAPMLARLLYFACSRRREYLADACSAQYTRYPEGLASALEKIAGAQVDTRDTSRVLAPMYVVSPLTAQAISSNVFSTHPATQDRVRVLRAIGKTASLASYEEAYRSLHGNRGVVGARTLASSSVDAPARTATAGDTEASTHKGWRDANDLLHRASGMLILACACGLRTRIPPGFNQPTIRCPKCGTVHSTSELAQLPSGHTGC